MTVLTKENEHYIEHEVKLRLSEHKFDAFEKRMDKMDHKLNFIIGIMIGSIFLPVAMKYLHLL
jgi:hypothetical protein